MILRGVVNAIFAVLGFALSCGAIRSGLPLPDVPQVKEKLEWFRAHRNDYTALFLGSSRVRRHIIPSLFDRLAAERGIAMRSFNLGVDSLAAPEDFYVLDQALAAAPARLRYVFIELSYFRANFAGQGAATIRSAYWHDWPRTWVVWRQLALADFAQVKALRKRKGEHRWSSWLADIAACAGTIAEHGRLFLQRTSNLGRGAAFLKIATGVQTATPSLAPLGPDRDGFIPSGADDGVHGAPATEYENQLAALRSGPSRQRMFDLIPQENLDRMLAKIRARGAEPILFLAPTSAGYVIHPRHLDARLFDFSDPAQWPQLFEAKYRADPGHLNTAGAQIFTRALAERFFASAEQR